MVSVVKLHPQSGAAALGPLAEGLAAPERALLARALEFAEPLYAGKPLSTGEPEWPHALGLAASLAAIGMDPVARDAGVLFAAPKHLAGGEKLREQFGEEVGALAEGVEKLYRLRVVTRASAEQHNETLRKMVLGMVEDIRVVLIRLASRTQTLRWFAKNPSEERTAYAQETLAIYAPLANRLGVWQLKWELEDLSFRFLEPEVYKKIAQMLDEKRAEREHYIADAMATLGRELAAARDVHRIADDRVADRLPDSAAEPLGIALRESARLDEVVRGVLDLTRSTPARRELASLNAVIFEALEVVTPQAEAGGVRIDRHLDAMADRVMIDRSAVKGAILNLCVNAIEAMPSGGTLTVRTPSAAGSVTAVIADTGPGIPEELRDRIFQPFFTRRDGGTGLGLPLAKRALEESGGTLSLSPRGGSGAEFIITFPVGAA